MNNEVICLMPNKYLKKNEVYTILERAGFHCNCGTIQGYYVGNKLPAPSPIICSSCGATFHTTDKIYHNSERFTDLEYNQESIEELLSISDIK